MTEKYFKYRVGSLLDPVITSHGFQNTVFCSTQQKSAKNED